MQLHRLQHFKYMPAKLGAVAVGLVLLLAGRRLFWLFVGAIGYIAASHFATTLLRPEDHTIALIAAVVVGIAGALLAIFVQKVAVGIAGGLAGAFYCKLLLDMNGVTDPTVMWIAILVATVFGALLMIFVFTWTLIIFSSVAGAHLVTHAFPLASELNAALFTVLLIVGLAVQARQLRKPAD